MPAQAADRDLAPAGAALWLRSLAGSLLAGLAVGVVVAGGGSRLVMRLLAVADPDARGALTENGNRIGEVTAGGTVALLVFVGIPIGVIAGLIVFAVRRWLPRRPVWRGLALSAVLLAALGGTVLDPENLDFRLLEPAGLAVALFGLLFLVAGYALAPLAERLAPDLPGFFFRRDVTLAGGTAIAVAVGFGLARVGGRIVDLV